MTRINRYASVSQYEALSDFRYLIIQYLKKSLRAAKMAGVEPQQHLLLLHLAGLSRDQQPTIRVLAERLESSHNAVVELVDRAVQSGLVKKTKRVATAARSSSALRPKVNADWKQSLRPGSPSSEPMGQLSWER